MWMMSWSPGCLSIISEFWEQLSRFSFERDFKLNGQNISLSGTVQVYFKIHGHHLVKYLFEIFSFFDTTFNTGIRPKFSLVDSDCAGLWDCLKYCQISSYPTGDMFIVILYHNIKIKFGHQGHCDKAKVKGTKQFPIIAHHVKLRSFKDQDQDHVNVKPEHFCPLPPSTRRISVCSFGNVYHLPAVTAISWEGNKLMLHQ